MNFKCSGAVHQPPSVIHILFSILSSIKGHCGLRGISAAISHILCLMSNLLSLYRHADTLTLHAFVSQSLPARNRFCR